MDILRRRLANQGLLKPLARTPAQVVEHLGAVQAQDWPAAKWSLALRLPATITDAALEDAYNRGDILRTHVMRPTWHFVPPADIRWMQTLTAPRVKQLLGHYNRKLELDDTIFAHTNAVITRALTDRGPLTRQELKVALATAGVPTDVQRLGHIVSWAELDALICSGPRRGKQFTYALLSERAPHARDLPRDQALATLATRYFQSHGPAQLKDFVWWSGLTTADAQTALGSIAADLDRHTLDNRTYYFTPGPLPRAATPPALFMSIFDEYTIAYKDRSDLSAARDVERLIGMGNALTGVVILDGQVGGTWKRTLTPRTATITISSFRPLTTTQTAALHAQASRYGQFLGLQASLQV